MRGFIICFCFAIANAEKLGYNYTPGGSHNGFSNRFKHRGHTVTPAPGTNSNNGIATGINGGLDGFTADTIPREQYGPNNVDQQPEYNKEFFSYTAPEEEFNDINGAERLAGAMRKNLRIVFIKAPENNGLANAALQLAKQTAESKTAIYVLSKQTDIADLANKIQTVQQSHSEKPEVHFIKYRTPEDAIRAQQIIQQEYDNFAGPSLISNEGVAPVLDFASKGEGFSLKTAENADNGGLGVIVPTLNGYLPPKLRQ